MIIRMRTHYAGPRGNCPPGRTIEVADDEARALIAGGYAVSATAAPEIADDEAAEAATEGPRERRSRGGK